MDKTGVKECELNVIGQCTVPPDWCGNVKNNINRLYYIYRGNGGYIMDGARHEFESERIYLIPAFSRIPTYAPPENRIYHAYADYELIPPLVCRKVLSIDPHVDPETEAALGVFIALCKDKETIRTPDKEKYLSDTVIFLSKKVAYYNGVDFLKDEQMLKALELMHSRLREKITISDIAEACFMSTEGFIRKFKTYTGTTPYSYMKRLKIRVALKLRDSGVSWDEAAEACGYRDASSLLHSIKKQEI